MRHIALCVAIGAAILLVVPANAPAIEVTLFHSANDDGVAQGLASTAGCTVADADSGCLAEGSHTLHLWANPTAAPGGGTYSIQDILVRAGGSMKVSSFQCDSGVDCLAGEIADPTTYIYFSGGNEVSGDFAAFEIGTVTLNVESGAGVLEVVGGTALAANFESGTIEAPTVIAQTVPEPGMTGLALTALLCISVASRRRNTAVSDTGICRTGPMYGRHKFRIRHGAILSLFLCVTAWSAAATDVDCDGIPDDGDLSGIVGDNPCTGGETANCDDNCRWTWNAVQEDGGGVGALSTADGIGDACQCGDVDDDARVTLADATLVTQASLNQPPFPQGIRHLPAPEKCDVGGTAECSGLDGTLIRRASLGLGPGIEQVCAAAVHNDSFVDAHPARVSRLDQVLSAAGAMFDGGATYTEIANMLASENDVENVSSNGTTLFFDVCGLPTFITDTAVASFGAPPREEIPGLPGNCTHGRSIRASELAQVQVSGGSAASILPKGQRMVGNDDDDDGFRDLPKHALILSPYFFQFTEIDSGPVVASILEGIRDYQPARGGSVTYYGIDTDLTTDTMLLSDYVNDWSDQDIIFIATHGGVKANCGPFVQLGIAGSTCVDLAAKLQADTPEKTMLPGLYCTWTNLGPDIDNPISGVDVGATSRFFEKAHGRDRDIAFSRTNSHSLDKKLIYIDACRSAAEPLLAQTLTGPDSVFFGWTHDVDAFHSKAVASAIIGKAAEDGFPVLRSFVSECESGACVDPDGADLLATWQRADLRVREALKIPTTPVHGACAVSASFPLSLTCPSCVGGPPMSMTFDFTVEGLEADDMTFLTSPTEFARHQLRLFADVDEMESGYATPVSDLTMISVGNGEYENFPVPPLYVDNVCPNQIIEYNPWVLLPAFDEDRPGNDARDRIYSWDGPFTIEIVPTQFP